MSHQDHQNQCYYFRFAQHLGLDEENYTIKGSPLYMAPEIIIKHKYDPRADLWSIGTILFECLFGYAPYSSKTIEELMEKVRSLQKIEIPKNSKISAECEDLLTRLLQHDPDKRITFEEFFNHDFIDLKHAPSDENLEHAIEIVTKAVEQDTMGNYQQAYYLYCEGLTYFVPLIESENGAKKAALRARATAYLQRAEEIKYSVICRRQQSDEDEANVEKIQPTVPSTSCVVQMALTPSQQFTSLCQKCSSNPQMKTGLDIGTDAEYYAFERKLDVALEAYKRALSILVPLLSDEPEGERKKLLHKQILDWMKEAESIKSILQAQEKINDDDSSSSSTSESSHCVLS